MKSTLLLALVVLATIGETLVLARHASHLHEWAQYKRQHGKVYESPEEDARRFSLYLLAKEQIRQHNANEQASYKMGLSHLSDWTQEEFAQLNGLRRYSPAKKHAGASEGQQLHLKLTLRNISEFAESGFDWRDVPGRVTAVKDQGKCASDWAFAATGLLEGAQGLYHPNDALVSLSEQQLVDCSASNQGCRGGTIISAMKDVALMTGIESEQDYPYVGATIETCKFNASKCAMSGYGGLEVDNDEHKYLKRTVRTFGPMAVGVHVNENFKHYKSGIFNDPTCGPLENTDHAALVVGYGTDSKVGDYWIVVSIIH